jgi:hypothetical protein
LEDFPATDYTAWGMEVPTIRRGSVEDAVLVNDDGSKRIVSIALPSIELMQNREVLSERGPAQDQNDRG